MSVIDRLHCMYCGNSHLMKYHTEDVHTGDLDSKDGWEIWFCCHPCRDAGKPCETFFKIPLDDDSY